MMSSSGVLGKYLTINSTVATLGRCAIGGICLFLISSVFKISLELNWKKNGIVYIGTTILLAAHWITYFYALDYSNVSIALMTLYTFPAMTSVIEPIWKRQPIPKKDLLLALIALVAVCIIAPPMSISGDMLLAVGLGLTSALVYSLRNIWLGTISNSDSGMSLMTVQLFLMTILLAPVLLWIPIEVKEVQWTALIMLGLITTAGGHTLFLRGVAYYEATTASILATIVPVYGIALAYFFLAEIPTLRTVIGGLIIILIVLVKALDRKKG